MRTITQQRERLPDEPLIGSPAENPEVCASVVIISTELQADVFLEADRLYELPMAA